MKHFLGYHKTVASLSNTHPFTHYKRRRSHNLVPVPPDILAAEYNDARYLWERMNWGCKWGACHPTLEDEYDGHLHYAFDTAWVPPIAFLEKLGPQWPTLTFLLDYEEMSMGFKGITKIAGHSVEDHCVNL